MLVHQRADAPGKVGGRHLEHRRGLLEGGFEVDTVAARRLAGQRLDPPDAGGARRFAHDAEQPDIAGAFHVGAAAELDRIGCVRPVLVIAHGDDTHLLAVLLAEERERAGVDRFVGAHQAGDQRRVLADQPVDLRLDVVERVGRDRAGWLMSKRSRSGATSEPFWVT